MLKRFGHHQASQKPVFPHYGVLPCGPVCIIEVGYDVLLKFIAQPISPHSWKCIFKQLDASIQLNIMQHVSDSGPKAALFKVFHYGAELKTIFKKDQLPFWLICVYIKTSEYKTAINYCLNLN